MKHVGIVYRQQSAEATQMALMLETHLKRQNISVWTETAENIHDYPREILANDMLLVLGGDGTILSAARLCAKANTPILGVNYGHVGFLAELEPHEIIEQLPYYLRGEHWVDERTMLQAKLISGGTEAEFLALNDIVLVRGAQPRLIRFNIYIDSHYYATTTADGIIVSSATGSTAYNLSAGGPILHPSVRGSVLTPIASHLAGDRSIVLEPYGVVRLELLESSADAIVSADGQINNSCRCPATLSITNSPYFTRFLRRRDRSQFYHVLTSKIRGRGMSS
jgi:NAD+ kinase